MTWSERRRYFLEAERRVLAGEPKTAVLAHLCAAGDDRREAARTLARIVSPSRRRRYRWPQRLFIALVVAAGVTSALSPLSAFAHGRWFAVGVGWSALFFGLPLVGVLGWRSAGYAGVCLGGILAFYQTVRPRLGDLSHLGLAGTLTLSLYAALLIASPVLWRRLFPDLGWADGDPRRNADGEYLLVD